MTKIIDIRNQTPKRSSKRSISAITHIARHHSATATGDFFTFWNNRWRGLGWLTGGYHEIIYPDGTVELCYDPDMVTNGIGNHNSYTYHICLVGNGSFTPAQEKAWEDRAKLAMERFDVPVERVLGHKEFSGAATACPGIDMKQVRLRLKEVIEMSDKKPSIWAEASWKKALAKGIMNEGQGPKDALTREQLAVILDRLGKLD